LSKDLRLGQVLAKLVRAEPTDVVAIDSASEQGYSAVEIRTRILEDLGANA
jgi:hypothetical protein